MEKQLSLGFLSAQDRFILKSSPIAQNQRYRGLFEEESMQTQSSTATDGEGITDSLISGMAIIAWIIPGMNLHEDKHTSMALKLC